MKILLEKHFQLKFGHWLKEERVPGLFELKISHGNTVAFSKFESQQLPSLWKVYTEGLYHKESDLSIGLKPADCWFMYGDAYVVVMFEIPKNQIEFYLIHIREVMKLYEAGKKSITKKNCQEFGVMKSFK